MLNHKDLREKFIEFYKQRGHVEIGQASLVPLQDTSVLFTTAGMHPLIPYLLGERHPEGQRLVNIQRSLRTGDIDSVGDATHSTFFEMLGHWSVGDKDAPDGIGAGYFKKEAIEWSWQFVTEVLGIPKEILAVTIFGGDKQMGVGADTEAEQYWLGLGLRQNKIAKLGPDSNWWGPVHSTGPCGPNTEIFVHVDGQLCNEENCNPGVNDDHWIEIWNNVFMAYNKNGDGIYEELGQKNVDTGVGLERTIMTVNNLSSVYETDLYTPLITAISSAPQAHADRDVRIVADHIRASVFLIADSVLPGNKDRGYVLRRLIRRAVNVGRKIGFSDWELALEAVIGVYDNYYPHLKDARVQEIFNEEANKFSNQLQKALRFFENATAKHGMNESQAAKLIFLGFQSHALPLELGLEIFIERHPELNADKINSNLTKEVEAHKSASQKGMEKKFGGHGLILDTGELKAGNQEELSKVLRLHTATHLLQAGLRNVLGDHVSQKGSDINPERLRFDFTHSAKMTPEEIKAVEDWVNDKIKQDLPVQKTELSLDEAKKTGALHFFTHKYPDTVNVYFVGESIDKAVSKEFCGGPHVDNTGVIGKFKILKEESVSAGVRRIKATVE